MLRIRLKKGEEKAILKGYPWAHMRNLIDSSEQLLAEPGELAELCGARDGFIGVGTFNTNAPITFRLLTRKREAIDTAFFRARLERALKKREALFAEPFYRLIHAESDGVPGVVVDRFGDSIVLQISTAGMERLLPPLLEALETVITPKAIVFRGDIPARKSEGLNAEVKMLKGTVPEFVQVKQNGCLYLADLLQGQKTGWFYDQRDNHKLAGGYAPGKSMLDVFCHSGGFGLLAARQGAERVVLVDSSNPALERARQAAQLNNVAGICEFIQRDAFEAMQKLQEEGRRFDIVIADPPAFIKTREHIANGMKGYEKVARLAGSLTATGGILSVASCSHHATRPRFKEAVLAGIRQAGREAEILHYTGHAADHPVHPHLPQSEYLKALFVRVL